MPSFGLFFSIPKSEKEHILGICYQIGMLGCQEYESDSKTDIECYFGDETSLQAAKCLLQELIDPALLLEKVIKDEDWNARWRESIKPVKITDKIWVSPKWQKPEMREHDHWIKIEPKMTFGTGHHETTQLVSQAMQQIKEDIKESTLLDIGTGTGVLCFVADFFKASRCIGIEVDNTAVENIAENKIENSCSGFVDFLIGTVDSIKATCIFDIIVMNMLRVHSEPLLPIVNSHLNNAGKLIWSGLLLIEKKTIVNEAMKSGFLLESDCTRGEWWCGIFKKQVKSL